MVCTYSGHLYHCYNAVTGSILHSYHRTWSRQSLSFATFRRYNSSYVYSYSRHLRILTDPTEIAHFKRQLFSRFLFDIGDRQETDFKAERQMFVRQRYSEFTRIDKTKNCAPHITNLLSSFSRHIYLFIANHCNDAS